MKTRPYMTLEGDIVNIVNITDWLDDQDIDWDVSYEDWGAMLKEYLAKNLDTTYYAAPREDFSLTKAARKALEGNFKTVIVGDLS